MVAAAEASADQLIQREGRRVQLEESLDLDLPFLLPDGGFTCDTVRGIPSGFLEFLEPVCQKGERKHPDLLAEGSQTTLGKPRELSIDLSCLNDQLWTQFSRQTVYYPNRSLRKG